MEQEESRKAIGVQHCMTVMCLGWKLHDTTERLTMLSNLEYWPTRKSLSYRISIVIMLTQERNVRNVNSRR